MTDEIESVEATPKECRLEPEPCVKGTQMERTPDWSVSSFQCETCGEIFGDRLDFTKHQKAGHEIKKIKCDVCNEEFTEASFEDHRALHVEGKEEGIAFDDMEKATVVMPPSHVPVDGDPLGGCGFVLDSVDDHKSANAIDQDNVKDCSEKLKALMLLNKHPLLIKRRKRRKERAVFQCPVCEYKTTASSNFNIHMLKHSKKFLVECDKCGKGYFDKALLAHHQTTRHSGEIVIHQCSVCLKVFSSSRYLRLHAHGHDDPVGGFQCETCGKLFKSWHGYRRHDRSEHREERYQCDVCNKIVSSLASLKQHTMIHTGEKRYVCSICGKSFILRNGLICHERVHTGEKPYKCETCNKCFTQRSTLVIHLRIHTGEKPYECKACDKRFVSKSILNIHVKGKRCLGSTEVSASVPRSRRQRKKKL